MLRPVFLLNFWNFFVLFDGSTFPNDRSRFFVISEHAMRASGCWFLVIFWYPFSVIFYDFGIFGIACKISPFVRVLYHVIKFLTSPGITNISPAIGTEAKTADMVQVSNRHMRPLGPRVGKQRHKARPIMHLAWRQPAELQECWRQTEQADRPRAFPRAGSPGQAVNPAGHT